MESLWQAQILTQPMSLQRNSNRQKMYRDFNPFAASKQHSFSSDSSDMNSSSSSFKDCGQKMIELEVVAHRGEYEEWKKELDLFLRYTNFNSQQGHDLKESLFVPAHSEYEKGSAKVYYLNLMPLNKTIDYYITRSINFTSNELWSLLYHLVEFTFLDEKTQTKLPIHGYSIFCDTFLKRIHLSTPHSFFKDLAHVDNIPTHRHIVTQTSKTSPSFMIGLLIAQCLLLKDLQKDGVPVETSEFAERISREIVALNRYSVPLKVMTIGLMQQGEKKVRHGEVYRLLREYREDIMAMKEDIYIHKDKIRQAFGARGEQLLQLFDKSKGDSNNIGKTVKPSNGIEMDRILNQAKGNYGYRQQKFVKLPQTCSVLQQDNHKGVEFPNSTPYAKRPYEQMTVSQLRKSPIEKLLFELKQIDQNAVIQEKNNQRQNRLSSSIVSAVDKLTDLLEEETKYEQQGHKITPEQRFLTDTLRSSKLMKQASIHHYSPQSSSRLSIDDQSRLLDEMRQALSKYKAMTSKYRHF